MRLPTERQAFAFLEPLRGKSTTITVKSRSDDGSVFRFLLGCLAISKTYPVIFDTSAFVGTNIHSSAAQLPKPFLQGSSIIVPDDGSRIEASLREMMLTDTTAFLIDDLNALLYLMSPTGERSGIRRLSAFFHVLAYAARTNRSFAIGMVYKTDSGAYSSRSLPGISELQVDAEIKGGELSFSSAKAGWPCGEFSVPFYLDPST